MGLKGFLQDWNACCKPAINLQPTMYGAHSLIHSLGHGIFLHWPMVWQCTISGLSPAYVQLCRILLSQAGDASQKQRTPALTMSGPTSCAALGPPAPLLC